MSAQFWDTVASRFDDEIFNTLSNDRSRTILRHIDRFSSTDSTVCDFGCGVGRYLPLLAERFRAVCAVDISRKCLEVAERNYPIECSLYSAMAAPACSAATAGTDPMGERGVQTPRSPSSRTPFPRSGARCSPMPTVSCWRSTAARRRSHSRPPCVRPR